MGAELGSKTNPLLVSCRSGARESMPGMMDTVLNLGLNDETVQGLARLADERFAFDSYRRFVHMYSDVVLGVPHERFETRLEHLKERRGVELDTELRAADWREVIDEYLALVEEHTGRAFPQDPQEQLWGAVGAVFQSWGNDRAVRYRRIHGLPDSPITNITLSDISLQAETDLDVRNADNPTYVRVTRDIRKGVAPAKRPGEH